MEFAVKGIAAGAADRCEKGGKGTSRPYIIAEIDGEETKTGADAAPVFRVCRVEKTQYPVLRQKDRMFFSVFLSATPVAPEIKLCYND